MGDTQAHIEARTELAVAETNTAYLLSNVFARLRLAGSVLDSNYDDTGDFGRILTELKDTDDGKLDHMHELRTEYGADLVVLVVENSQ